MKTKLKLSFILISIIFLSISCRKDKNESYTEISEEYLSIEIDIID